MSGTELFELILGRSPKAADWRWVTGRAGRGSDEALVALLTSHEFLINTVEPLLDGTSGPEIRHVPEPLQLWAEARFGLAPGARESRLALLLRMLKGPMLEPLAPGLDTTWSPGALIAAVEATLEVEGGPRDEPSCALAAARRVAGGLEIDALSGLSIGLGAREFRLDGESPSLFFRLINPPEAPDGVCRIDFGLLAQDCDPQGILWLDYGEGLERHGLRLFGRGRTSYTAYLAAPSRIKALRWDILADGPSVKLTNLSARRVSEGRIERQILAVAGRRGLDWLAGKRLPQLQPTHSAPRGFRLSQTLTRRLGAHNLGPGYPDWLADNELSGEFADVVWRKELAELKGRPQFELFVTVDDPDMLLLHHTVESVRRQIYPNWVVHIVPTPELYDACCSEISALVAHVGVRIAAHCDKMPIQDSLDAALAHATGDWLTVLSAGDVLRPDALLKMASRIGRYPDVRMLYSDHDELDALGLRVNPAFKPDFSPEMLMGRNYVESPVLFRVADVRSAGGWAGSCRELGEYHLIFKVLDKTDGDSTGAVEHVAEVLLHRRMRPAQSDEARRAAVEIVRGHLDRIGVQADVEPSPSGAGQWIRPHLPDPRPFLSFIMPTRDRPDLLIKSVGSILNHTAYSPFELLIVDNDSREAETHALFEKLCSDPRVRVLHSPGDFNYSYLNNFAAGHSSGDIVGLINNDIEVIEDHWATELVAWAALDDIGCVGSKLYYPDGRVQHGGIILGIDGVAAHSHKYAHRSEGGYGARLSLVHNLSAVTGACLFVKRRLYDLVGGLDQSLTVAFNDVDFCLKLRMAGFRNVMVPSVEMIHHESASRGADVAPEKAARFKRETNIMKDRWGSFLDNDPFYSPNLTRIHENFDFDWGVERGDRLWTGNEGRER